MNFNIYLLILLSFSAHGQTDFISGKVINSNFPPDRNLTENEFWDASGAVIIGNDSLQLGRADENGLFKIKVSSKIKTITISWVGMYPEKIELQNNCKYLEVILLPDVIYDFVTAKKEERLKKKDRKVLPDLYEEAYVRGIFTTKKPCK